VATVPGIPTPSIEDFYRAHAPAVRAFLISLSRDPHFADDLVQETFIKATRSLDGYRGGSPRAWLFSIARSVFIDAVRRTRAIPVDEVPESGIDAPDTGERLVIADVLEALPARQRRAILLVDEAGLSYQEAADVMGTTLGAMKVLLHRARSNFRSIYSENTDD
jgi:RNA polymerase sigma-70 factor (ECF subfamily)